MKMKVFLKTIVFAFMLSYCLTNCKRSDINIENNDAYVDYFYLLYLSFQDSTGVDLVKALEKNMYSPGMRLGDEYIIEDENLIGLVDTLLYKLDVIYPEWYDPDYWRNIMIQNGNIPDPVSPFQITLMVTTHPPLIFNKNHCGNFYPCFVSASEEIATTRR